MKYGEKSFSVALGSEEYSKNWDAVFVPKCPTCKLPKDDGPFCSNSFHLTAKKEETEVPPSP